MNKQKTYILLIVFWCSMMLFSTLIFERAIRWNIVILYFLIKVFIFSMIIVSMILFFKHIYSNSLKSQPIILVISSLVLTIFTTELVFTFVPQSSHLQVSLASWNWHVYYHKPINNKGFRDSKDIPEFKPNKKTVFFIGDSYTEGYGIKDISNRFSDRIADDVSDTYQVFNLGLSGTALTEQMQLFESLPFHPDILVWQVFFNDVDDICFKLGYEYPNLDIWKSLNPISLFLIKNSYLVNYCFFKFSNQTVVDDFILFLNNCSKDRRLEIELENRIIKIKSNYAFGNNKLLFILIPSTFEVYMADEIYKIFEKVLVKQNIQYINFQNHLISSYPYEYSVNKQDMHINERAAKKISEIIYTNLFHIE